MVVDYTIMGKERRTCVISKEMKSFDYREITAEMKLVQPEY